MSLPTILPDIPRIYTGIAEAFACILYLVCCRSSVNRSGMRFKILIVIGGQITCQLVAGSLPISLWIPGMLLNIGWMWGSVSWLCQTTRSAVVFLTLKAFIVSELIAATAWQLYVMFGLPLGYHFSSELISQLVIFVILLSMIYLIESRFNWVDLLLSITRKEAVITFVSTAMIFLFSNMGFLLSSTIYHLGNSLAVFTLRIFVDIGGLVLLYLQQLQLVDQQQRRELVLVQSMFQSQYRQYRTYAEKTHYINRKAHDLKHQLAVLMAEEDGSKRQAYVEQMQEAIAALETKVETGHSVLDTILSQKKWYCQEHQINFSCMANGQLLEFMSVLDICSLFGNSLDNAIEHVEQIEDVTKRLIIMKLTQKGKMIILRVENYCEDNSIQQDVIPASSKLDTTQHGFGLKNIAYIVRKYDGTMTFDIEDHWFCLTVIFPMSI